MTTVGIWPACQHAVHRSRWTLFSLLLLALIIGVLMPGQWKHAVEGELPPFPWSMAAHFVLFAGIAAVPVYAQGSRGRIYALVFAACLAIATELLQSFVPGRHPMVRDALIDLSGAFLGAWVQPMLRTR